MTEANISEQNKQKADYLKSINTLNVQLYEEYRKYFYRTKRRKPHLHQLSIRILMTNYEKCLCVSVEPVNMQNLDFSYMPFSDTSGIEYICVEKYIDVCAGLLPILAEAKLNELEESLKRAHSTLTKQMDLFRKYQTSIIHFYHNVIENEAYKFEMINNTYTPACVNKIMLPMDDYDFNVKLFGLLVKGEKRQKLTQSSNIDKVYQFYKDANTIVVL